MLSVTNLEPEAARTEVAAIEAALPKRVRFLVGGRAATTRPGSEAEVLQDLAATATVLNQ